MFNIFKTLAVGAAARTEEHLESKFSIELIRQKIREAQASVNDAKAVLVTLMQRQKVEGRQLDGVKARIKELSANAKDALKKGRDDLAGLAAQSIADLENEAVMRQTTVSRLEARVLRLRGSLEKMSRRLVDLKQGEIAAKAYRSETNAQSKLNKTLGSANAFNEAEELIGKVLAEDDAFEQAEIMADLDADLSGASVDEQMSAAGIGSNSKTTAADVLARLSGK